MSETRFFQFGWLIPTVFPLMEAFGRTPFTLSTIVYFFWCIYSIIGKKIKFEAIFLVLYFYLIFCFGMSSYTFSFQDASFQKWIHFALYSSSFPLIFLVLHYNRNIIKFTHMIAIFAMLSLVILYLKLPYYIFYGDQFTPEFQLSEDNLPFLMPFILYWAYYVQKRVHPLKFSAILYLIIFAYIILSQGRAALFALTIGTFCYFIFVVQWKIKTSFLLMLTLLCGAILISSTTFFRGTHWDASWVKIAERFTAYRSTMWAQAIDHPPENILTGVGMNNLQYYPEVINIYFSKDHIEHFKHLHNFLFDVTFETGLLGMSSLLLFLLYCLYRGIKSWCAHSIQQRRLIGVYLSAIFAILAAALLSFSYYSKPFNLYLLLFFSPLMYLTYRHPKNEKK